MEKSTSISIDTNLTLSMKPQHVIESSSEESSNNNEGGISDASSDDGEDSNSK